MENLKVFKKITPYIFFYFIFSFLGWAIETIYCYCMVGHYVSRGFLFAPICPIYRNRCTYANNIFR